MEAREALLTRVSAADGETEIKDPATGAVIGRHTFGTAADVRAAVDKAAAAQPAWAALADSERVGYLLRMADHVEAHAEELAYSVSREQGKTMSGIGARYEIEGCVGRLRATASLPLPVEVLVDDGASYAEMHYRPIGVVGAITPMELAADHRRLADRPVPAHGQHGRAEAERVHHALRPSPHRRAQPGAARPPPTPACRSARLGAVPSVRRAAAV
ncbi:MAG: aldehyde dehydrogenase family protein [Trebonia sp.]|jgi:hypothetical protein